MQYEPFFLTRETAGETPTVKFYKLNKIKSVQRVQHCTNKKRRESKPEKGRRAKQGLLNFM